LEHEGVLLVEAGTGVGKTLAYLIPAILSGQKIVVSTGTKTLQDQIMRYDLPFLEGHLGVSAKAVCVKGLANYLCLRRYHEFRSSPSAIEGPLREGSGRSPSLVKRLPLPEEWVARTRSGDRSELEGLEDDDPLWTQVSSSPETRIGARCEHHD